MKKKLIFVISGIGLVVAVVSAIYFGLPHHAEPPAFTPAANPFAQGIYSNGIIESDQPNGANSNLYFEVAGTVSHIFVREGQAVKKGEPLIALDDSVPRRTAEQQKEQAAAAQTQLQALKAQPRPEALAVAKAQEDVAAASRQLAAAQYEKLQHASGINPGAVSRDALDNAANALRVAEAGLALAHRQYMLTKAGAWSFDIANQEQQAKALAASAAAAVALLDKFTLRAPADGTVLAIRTSEGSLVTPQGSYDTYTQGLTPAIVTGTPATTLAVRCYIDEILVQRMPPGEKIRAEMSLRGTDIRLPLEFVRIQPYVSPKIQLSDQRQERVDVRVLPVIFRFRPTPQLRLYPGQLVDVYIGQEP